MASFIKITYNVSSTTVPTYVALYEKGDTSHISVWWDKVTFGSSGGTVVTVEPWAPQGTSVWFYGYQFPSTGEQELFFFPSGDTIPAEAFKMCDAITEIDCTQATGITTIESEAFELCDNLTTVSLADSITSLGSYCFQQDHSLTTVNIPSGVTQLKTGLFSDCTSLTSFTVPDQVTWVRNSVFSDCRSLQEVKFGSGLTYLGTAVFNRCSALTSITATSLNNISYASDNPDYGPPFYDMATGGTLYYPASREATYGPDNGWLKDEEYWLGYYDWNGVATGGTPEPPIPSGETAGSGSTAITENYSGCPLVFDHSASTGTWNTLPTVTTGGSAGNWTITFDVPANDTDSARTITYYYLRYSGANCDELVDTIPFTISQAAGSGTSPVTSWINLTYTSTTVSADTAIKEIGIGVRTSGCSMYTGAQSDFSYTVSGATNMISGVSELRQSDPVGHPDGYNISLYYNKNTSTSPREAYITFTFKDTSGNTYNDTFHLMQLANKQITLNPSYFIFQSGSSSVTATFSAANTTIQSINLSSSSASIGSFDVYPTVTISGNDLLIDMPENPAGGAYRSITYSYVVYDSDGDQHLATLNLYQQPGYTPEPAPSGTSIYLSPTGVTANPYDTSIPFTILASGCVLDTTNFSYTTSGDSFITGISLMHVWENQYAAMVSLTPNTAVTNKNEYVDFVFYNTSGHQYTDTGIVEQLKNVYLALNPDYFDCTSAQTRIEITIEEVNCTFDHMSVEYTYGSFDEASMAQITSSVTGNKLIIVIPKNGYGEPWRYAGFQFGLYDTDGNYSFASFYIDQQAGGGPENIAVNITDVNVGSGSSSTSGTISTTSCTYDHFTYMTGGSIPLTVTSGANNTININAPANNTSNSRVGYAYITFYDTDGNQYYQTVTIRQAAGTGPGPGPQPEPTWNVLTSLTISDNEQHRFFVEAELGKSYKANGIEYKTVSACEARYSLYYINSYGGVDVMVFKGRSNKKTDNVTRFNYSRSFRNNTLEFENVNYMNEIKATWELQTGWLVDKQSKKMHELVESTCVYLYDAQEQVYIPVVMTDKTLEYKTYHNQNNRFYNYTIKVEESQSRERR